MEYRSCDESRLSTDASCATFGLDPFGIGHRPLRGDHSGQMRQGSDHPDIPDPEFTEEGGAPMLFRANGMAL